MPKLREQSLRTHFTTVVDAGGRYGMHPTWSRFPSALRYVAFEPDPDEARRLAEAAAPGCEVHALALGREDGEAELTLTQHRGCSTLCTPRADGAWQSFRPGELDEEARVRVRLARLDTVARELDLRPDFLKVDVEGAEHEVLLGARRVLAESVLGVRVTVFFHRIYEHQALVEETFGLLRGLGFGLLNLDYLGRGVPASPFYGNPDPLTLDTERYGVLTGCDGVWIRHLEPLGEDLADPAAALKLAWFCLRNNAPDVGLELLRTMAGKGGFSDAWLADDLYRGVRRQCAAHLGRWKARPGAAWEEARSLYRSIFLEDLPGMHGFWDYYRSL